MKHLLITVMAALLPMTSMAAALDDPLKCGISAHEFISSLEQQGLIDPKPMHVEDNSINAFQPSHKEVLTAYDFHVFAIVGYQKNDPLFQKGDGQPISNSAYGAVVLGGFDSVQEKVEAAHSTAVVHKVAPFITAIFCDRD